MPASLIQENPTTTQYTNPSSSAIIPGFTVVSLPDGWGIAQADIAASGTGTLIRVGRFEVPKQAGTALAQGLRVGYDTVNDRVTTNLGGKVFGVVAVAAGSSDTTVQVDLFGYTAESAFVFIDREVTAAEATANAVGLSAAETGMVTDPLVLEVDIFSAAGARKAASKAVTYNGDGTITVAITSVVAGDRVSAVLLNRDRV